MLCEIFCYWNSVVWAGASRESRHQPRGATPRRMHGGLLIIDHTRKEAGQSTERLCPSNQRYMESRSSLKTVQHGESAKPGSAKPSCYYGYCSSRCSGSRAKPPRRQNPSAVWGAATVLRKRGWGNGQGRGGDRGLLLYGSACRRPQAANQGPAFHNI